MQVLTRMTARYTGTLLITLTTRTSTLEHLVTAHFSMLHKSVRDGKEYIETIDMIYMGSDKLRLNITATIGGVEQETIKGTFTC